MIWPRLRRMKFISCTTIATIFTDEIESAVPRKIAVTKRSSGLGKIESGSISPNAKPHAKGTATPTADTATAARPTRRTNLRSVSMPVSSRSMRMPSCDTASIMLFCSAFFGKNRVLQVRPKHAEYGGTEHDAGNELAHDGGLADPLHGLAQQPPNDEQNADLREEDCLRGTRRNAFRRQGIRSCQ